MEFGERITLEKHSILHQLFIRAINKTYNSLIVETVIPIQLCT